MRRRKEKYSERYMSEKWNSEVKKREGEIRKFYDHAKMNATIVSDRTGSPYNPSNNKENLSFNCVIVH